MEIAKTGEIMSRKPHLTKVEFNQHLLSRGIHIRSDEYYETMWQMLESHADGPVTYGN